MSAEKNAPFIEVKNLSKSFGGTVALNRVDLSITRGEIHCLVGENGSGKSTLIKILSGVHSPDGESSIHVDGRHYRSMTTHRSKELGIQVIYQDLSLFPNLSVAENIAIDQLLGNPAGTISRREMRVAASAILQNLEHQLPLDAIVGTLSVAQRQIVAIARGLATNARLIFMDEPTASLTRTEVRRLFEIVRKLQRMQVSIVFVSHRMNEIVEIAERVSVLRDGSMIGTFEASQVTDHDLSELMTGQRIVQEIKTRAIAATEPVLEVRDLSRTGEFSGVNLTLHRGEIVGLTGLLGAGRTELALAMFGMNSPDSGQILLEGREIRLESSRRAIEAGIAYVSEDRLSLGLNLRQSISDNISLSVLDRIKQALGIVPLKARTDLAERWVERLGIKAGHVEAAVQTLSGGNQQRVVLAKWLATDPKVLILDSPTVGVDIRNKQGIYDKIRELANAGVAILMISDEISEVYFNADRVLHMRQGQIVEQFVPGEMAIETVEEHVYA